MAGDIPEQVREKFNGVKRRYEAFRGGLTPRQRTLLHALTFLLRFTLLAAPFYLLLDSGWNADGLRRLTAHLSAAVLRTVGVEASSTGSFLRAGDLLVNVTRDSTGWKSVIAFTALVVASQRPWRSRLAGIVAGVAAIVVANLLRVTSTVYATTVFGIDYELLHTVLWRWGLTAAVIVIWAVWMRLSLPSARFGLLERR